MWGARQVVAFFFILRSLLYALPLGCVVGGVGAFVWGAPWKSW